MPCRSASCITRVLLFTRWMRDTYTPFILSPLGKALVLLATGGLLASGLYGATEVRAFSGLGSYCTRSTSMNRVSQTLKQVVLFGPLVHVHDGDYRNGR